MPVCPQARLHQAPCPQQHDVFERSNTSCHSAGNRSYPLCPAARSTPTTRASRARQRVVSEARRAEAAQGVWGRFAPARPSRLRDVSQPAHRSASARSLVLRRDGPACTRSPASVAGSRMPRPIIIAANPPAAVCSAARVASSAIRAAVRVAASQTPNSPAVGSSSAPMACGRVGRWPRVPANPCDVWRSRPVARAGGTGCPTR